MPDIGPIEDLIQQDDASRYFKTLSDEELYPRFEPTSLGRTGTSFTDEEVEAVFASFDPQNRKSP